MKKGKISEYLEACREVNKIFRSLPFKQKMICQVKLFLSYTGIILLSGYIYGFLVWVLAVLLPYTGIVLNIILFVLFTIGLFSISVIILPFKVFHSKRLAEHLEKLAEKSSP